MRTMTSLGTPHRGQASNSHNRGPSGEDMEKQKWEMRQWAESGQTLAETEQRRVIEKEEEKRKLKAEAKRAAKKNQEIQGVAWTNE